MALSSMTGFARGHGVAGSYAWAWELKSVNSKGLDLKLRLPLGWEVSEAEESEDERSAAEVAVVAGFGQALKSLVEMRRTEGQALGKILSARLSEIGALAARAEASPGRKPEAIKARLAAQVAELLEASQRLDPDRLHQEAIMLASKIDIREELDRLGAHVAQAINLLNGGGPIGRKLDFLS